MPIHKDVYQDHVEIKMGGYKVVMSRPPDVARSEWERFWGQTYPSHPGSTYRFGQSDADANNQRRLENIAAQGSRV